MKALKNILINIPTKNIVGTIDIHINKLQIDSRKIEKNDVFFAIKGTTVDGHLYINTVIENGANTIVCEILPQNIANNITYIVVDDARKTCALMACNFYENPSQKLKLVGVTGTNGKTTITTLLYQVYKNIGEKVGLISTIRNLIHDTEIISTHTTPDPISINALLHNMVMQGCTYAFMEVSSHAAEQDRIAGLHFTGGIFINITHDHLDYHKTFLNYINAKKIFFDNLPKEAFALTNIDDKRGEIMLQNTAAKKYTFAVKTIADFRFKILENSFGGLVLDCNGIDVHTKMIGRFNVYNLLSIYATCVLLGMDKNEALAQISMLTTAEGRFDCEINRQKNIIGIVDYAHTPDALKNVLDTINEIRTKNETLITVVGCGGNRDKTKRPEMARIAAELSDKIIITSDNPRNEAAEDIITEMKAGIPPHCFNKVMIITDRNEAIKVACNLAKPNDIILLAGKGHEKYQEIKGIKYPFDDKAILHQTLNEIR